MATVTIVGAGMMGSALSVPLVDRGHRVRLVGTPLDHRIIAELKVGRAHPTLNLQLPEQIEPCFAGELASALASAEAVALGVSSAGVPWAAEALGPLLEPDLDVLMVSKGLVWDASGLKLLPDALRDGLPGALRARVEPVAIAGPCIAGELARRVPTCVLFAGRDAKACQRWAELARGPYYRVWPTADVVGAEVCAALKNAYAMAVGFGAGLHERRGGAGGSIAMHNYEAAVFAESIVEMRRVVSLAGGNPESAAGLAGAGDLNVTCNGGRTGRFGRLLGQGLSLEQAIAAMAGATLECLEILAVMGRALEAFDARGLIEPRELPLLRHLIDVAQGAAVDVPFDRFFAGA
jgi:glycerol-3-phosphate dehydrogenase (NAD(P)+)